MNFRKFPIVEDSTKVYLPIRRAQKCDDLKQKALKEQRLINFMKRLAMINLRHKQNFKKSFNVI